MRSHVVMSIFMVKKLFMHSVFCLTPTALELKLLSVLFLNIFSPADVDDES